MQVDSATEFVLSRNICDSYRPTPKQGVSYTRYLYTTPYDPTLYETVVLSNKKKLFSCRIFSKQKRPNLQLPIVELYQ